MKHFAIAISLLLPVTCLAQVRLYVATYGSNSGNNCQTMSTPCRFFQQAVNAATPGSHIMALDGGDFGPVTVNIPIVIDGGEHGAYISSPTLAYGFPLLVQINSTTNLPVVLRHLSVIDGTGAGIKANMSSGALVVDHVSVTFSGPPPIFGGGSNSVGISVLLAAGASAVLRDIHVSGTSMALNIQGPSPGGVLQLPATATLDHVTADCTYTCLNAILDTITIRQSNFTGFGGSTGAFIANQTSAVIEGSQFSNHATGISMAGGTARLSTSLVSGNAIGVSGAGLVSYRNNTFANNGSDGAVGAASSLR